ncbi:MAG TPA: hypothetical protein VHR97_02320 [Candidatus Baltobacteraceae bacterium]|nr:hypothetical protein [Candidatus Baltobacteraceae bacterium]
MTTARAGTLPDISGAWFPNGNPTILCRISQSGSSVSLTNEHSATATGTFTDPSTLSTAWGDKKLTGTISGDLRTITWSDGTYWSRASEPSAPEATPAPPS